MEREREREWTVPLGRVCIDHLFYDPFLSTSMLSQIKRTLYYMVLNLASYNWYMILNIIVYTMVKYLLLIYFVV